MCAMGNRWKKNMAAKLRTVHSCKTVWYIYNTRKSVLYFQSNGKVKRKWPIGRRLWILFWSIWLKIKGIVCVIIVAWNSVVNRPLASSCEILVASAKFLVALATRKAEFRTLQYCLCLQRKAGMYPIHVSPTIFEFFSYQPNPSELELKL